MINYQKRDFLEYMPDVQRYGGSLSKLNDQWDSIKLLSEINCPGQAKDLLPNMEKIQNSFYALQSELIETLTDETFKKLEQKTVSKAQVAVDILIRNLYERTADVGFLATDDDVRRFAGLREIDGTKRETMLKRLGEYVAKYSVYEEIILLDNDFTVLINLDQSNPIAGQKIDDPLLQETLDSTAGFVETFRKSDLQPGKPKAHIFSSKVCAEDTGELLGIICLCFKFENELELIFSKLAIDYDGSVIMIVDSKNTVLASSDENYVPSGVTVEAVLQDEIGVVYYRGMEYIAKTVYTKGYQGYYGLGWKGHVMIPLQLAFREKNTRTLDNFDPALTAGLMSKADSFSKALHEIILKTQQINDSLKRIVYNGQIMGKDEGANDEYYRLRPLLRNISRMGSDTSRLSETSVRDLFSTVISASLRDVSFLASLCIDIMDRNLYERANDCRWWALNSTFRTILAKESLTEQDHEKLTHILTYINSLYTVYSNLFLFDVTGKIIAVSNPQRSADIGKRLDRQYVRNILANANESQYYVSDFEANNLYEERYTYIYGASVTDILDGSRIVGGIGIVFDSDFQFRTMLKDSLSAKEGSFAVFTDRKGLIIAATREDMLTGSPLKVPPFLFKTENGTTRSEILVYENHYYAVGCACSSSYREYKHSDGYQNDVLAFMFEQLADYDRAETSAPQTFRLEQADIPLLPDQTHIKLASFTINDQLLALEYSKVVEVVGAEQIVKLPFKSPLIRGAIHYRNQYLAVVDMHAVLNENGSGTGTSHILVAQLKDGKLIGLEADELHNVSEVNASDIQTLPKLQGFDPSIKGVVSFHQGERMFALFLLDIDNLLQQLDMNMLKLDLEKAIAAIQEIDKKKS